MVHKFIQNNKYIVLDVHSGGVHQVDELTYKLLDYVKPPFYDSCPSEIISEMNTFDAEEIKECYLEIRQLYENNMLFTEDGYEKYSKLAMDAPIKAMCLHVSHDCNLRCKYCFADTGDFGGGRILMTPETGKQAIDFLIASSGDRVNMEVDFFGGEPLMAWDTVVQTVDYARSIEKQHGKNFRFTITTNGMLLDDEKIQYINKEMSNCVLSLDGRKDINDNIRTTPNGKGCYDIIVPKFQKLVSNRGDKDYYVRGTFTKYNLDFAEDVLHMRELGFEQISVEPVVTDEKYPYALTEKELPAVFSEYNRLAEIMETSAENKFNFFHFFVDLQQGPCAIKRLRGCGCGNEYVAVTPDGDIYPCHQFVGIDEWKMGNINKGIEKPEIKEYFSGVHIYSKEGCKDCWCKFYCSGGCNATSFIYEGDVKKPNKIACELMKKRIECAIALQCK